MVAADAIREYVKVRAVSLVAMRAVRPTGAASDNDRLHLAAFTHRLFPGYQTAAHIEALCAALEWAVNTPDARLIVTMPPRHSKSVHVSENLPAWFLGRHPDKRVISASHTAALAYTFSRRVRNKLNHPKWPFPAVHVADDKGAVQAWDIQGQRGGYIAVGVGGSPTGHGGDLIVIDDPIRSAADADSETMRDGLWEWYQETLRTRLEPNGSIILTATRWHDDDLTGRLLGAMAKGGEPWRHLHMPAISENGDALWPERWPLSALHSLKLAVGSRAWESQFQGAPIPSTGGMFKRDWWGRYRELPRIERLELVLDSAFKEGVANDYSVYSLWADDGRGSAYLVRVWRDKVDFPGLIRLGHDAYAWARQRFPEIATTLVIEDKASGQSALQVFNKPYYVAGGSLPALPIVAFTAPSGQSKISRAEGISGLVEGQRAFIPEEAEWLDDWLVEHERFPLGAHDDQVDTTAIALTRLLLNDRDDWSDIAEYSDVTAFFGGGR